MLLGELDEIVEHRARDAERDRAKAHPEHVEDREAVERAALAPVGVGLAREAVGLRHEQVLDRVVVAAGAAQAHDLPDVGHGGARFREQHGALLERLAVGPEPRRAVALADGAVAAEPLRVPAAAGEAPAPGDAIAAVDDDGLGESPTARRTRPRRRASPNISRATSGSR